ncbi:hypothetical protein QH494_02460 [Sphingomonas sp. AR_OL41]|uniref:hypothetical protein n=1 Tax=Sphingomonas sp. AR_OL41 TaxID=3042729 RepID=UPI00248116EC|nr:hypothetical protein [Sphingomonas sp. AR_OL41]MDH7971031.1 hypothetical protein [Sphingomonas sp. AR_OL41]
MTGTTSGRDDMRDLLIRVDTKVDGLAATLARMDSRADVHETRIATMEIELAVRPDRKAHDLTISRIDTVEDWQIERDGMIRGAATTGVALKSAIVAIAMAISALGYQVFLHAPPAGAATAATGTK